uniref:Thiol:disulfide interchange protein n=1 Tax=Dipterocladia arabiensis TaxID=2007176 RepID=A0A1Z1M0D4_9FLOR|nr:thiol:disulfide interchange protein [Dipterocladia arabiensis]ARW59311.1 thiol:disulfide interchange protein [Dipterocladia arabiensis]
MLYTFNFMTQYEFIIYNLQQMVASLLFVKVNLLDYTVMILLVFAGLLTSLTPCFLSILPLSVSYISANKNNYLYKNFFILGILTSLFFFLIISNFINYSYIVYLNRIPFLSFLILILISLNLLQILDFSSYLQIFNNQEIDLSYNNRVLHNYMIGLVIGFSTIPCSSPIILLVNFWLHGSTNIFFSIFYFTLYFFGCIIPFLIIFYFVFNILQTYIFIYIWNAIIPLAGFFLLSFSILSFLEKVFI